MTILSSDVKRIGLMADSHGKLSAMSACVERFKDYNPDAIIHLGDFLDSFYLTDAVSILEAISRHQIAAVKGNNDYHVEKSLGSGSAAHILETHRHQIQSFLSNLPMKILFNNICFTHSLPYDSVRSFYEPIDTGNTDRAIQIFQNTTHQIIFSGHSHAPILFRFSSGRITRENISQSSPTILQKDERFIIIVGAASEGESGVIDLNKMEYTRIRI